MTQIAVLGPGGVGGFVAAALARSGSEVVVVAQPDTAAIISQRGLEVRQSTVLGPFTVHPPAVDRLEQDVDILLVATKAGGLAEALERVAVDPRLVVPLLNGVEHMHLLEERFSEALVAGVIRIEADRPEPGVIVQSSPGARVDIARAPEMLVPTVGTLAEALRAAGLQVHTGELAPVVLWSKLARLAPLALTTSASDRPIGFVRSDPRWRSALEGAVRETVAVARAEGAQLDAARTLEELEAAHAELGSSMQRDIAAGRSPELDPIAGAVLRAGRRHGLRSPTVQWLAEQVARRAAAQSGGRTGGGGEPGPST
jgi:2-dehydropantoate 2-reductase